ncbi:succinyl-diaminopimelate desuccinylase [Helicobacter sp. 11S02629-2]|uniref:succinyl-diaminopimelate desuccinylase n=1 Tax=Helicobacter sp. 11S02629-2 TaxID=1476195 RepID=UPI000BA5FE2B|nr:succinyl-diaminopimelate desuccinylase [Helicobacter sp. 11S02629-2]PAF45646.1 succinyl-diaminopimelate desuccinylase [Helicobacter sp. 11S02629-2]
MPQSAIKQTQDILTKLISYKTITPNEEGIYTYIKSLLPEFEVIALEKNGVKNLFLYKKYENSKIHLCFAGHIDVVPPGIGWASDPFSPTLKEGFIYGRGTQDMKGGIACFLSALRSFLDSNKEPKHTLSILLTSDEEGRAIDGTLEMLKHLKDIDFLPTHALVAEPTCEKILGDSIKVGRRGSINGTLELFGIQGHAAYPEKCSNPIELIASRLSKLAGVKLDSGDSYFEPSRLIITDMHAGTGVTNLTPQSLRLLFNVRNSTLTTKESIKNYIDSILSGLNYKLELEEASQSFVLKDAKNNAFVKALSACVKKVCDITPSLNTKGGTSDAKYFSRFNVEVVELGVINDRIHAVDERVSLKELDSLTSIYYNLLKTIP